MGQIANLLLKGGNIVLPNPIHQSLTDELKISVVKYAITNIDQDLFVSKYLIELPKEEDIKALIERDRSYLLSKT